MKEIVRVLETYYSDVDNLIVLDKPYFTRCTKLTDGFNTIEVMLTASHHGSNRHYYNIRNMTPHKWKWESSTVLTETSHMQQNLFIHDVTRCATLNRCEYGREIKPPKEIQKWIKEYVFTKLEPLYLEEELVPSQFFGLNDYLKSRI